MTVWVGVVLATVLVGTSPASPPQFVPGEILARFARGTDGDAAVIRAGQATPPDLGVLIPVINRLQVKTGVPLKATQLLGGKWLKLSVDGDGLTDRLVRELRARENIAEVQVRPAPLETPVGTSVPQTIVVMFSSGSAEYAVVAQKSAGAGDARFAQLMHELERGLDVPLRGEVSEKAELLVHVDLQALTPILADRIAALCDIEAAQPNYIVTIK